MLRIAENRKDIPNFEGLYICSNLGRIIRVERYVKNRNGLRKLKEKEMKSKIDKDGYEIVCLHKNKKQYTFGVHRLVAITFISKDDLTKTQVNHRNGIKTDNRVENLEWVTPKENIVHAISTGLRKKFKTSNHNGENNPNSKLSKNEVLDIINNKSNGLNIKNVYEKYKTKISYSGLEQIWYGYRWKEVL